MATARATRHNAMPLKKSDIQIPDLPRKTIEVPELGGEVVVQGLLLRDRTAIYLDSLDDDGDVDTGRYTLSILYRCVVQEDGSPLLSMEEWDRLGGGSKWAAVSRLAGECRSMVGDDPEATAGESTGPGSDFG